MERAIIFTLRLLNSAASFAARPSSVVHTGVKSRGWENRMPHLEGEGRSWCEGEMSFWFVLQTKSCTDCMAWSAGTARLSDKEILPWELFLPYH